jgi:hypothetical protein
MELFRFRFPVKHIGHSYGYIKANFWERRKIRERIAQGDSGITTVEQLEQKLGCKATGPRAYGAQFIITAKKVKA